MRMPGATRDLKKTSALLQYNRLCCEVLEFGGMRSGRGLCLAARVSFNVRLVALRLAPRVGVGGGFLAFELHDCTQGGSLFGALLW